MLKDMNSHVFGADSADGINVKAPIGTIKDYLISADPGVGKRPGPQAADVCGEVFENKISALELSPVSIIQS